MNCTISKTFRFEASHVLPKHTGKCSRLHGHSWVLTVSVQGPVNTKTGFVVDYGDLKALVDKEVIERLDHTHLGQYKAIHSIPEGELIADHLSIKGQCPFGWAFYPSSENLVIAVGKLLQPLVKELSNGVTLHQVELEETCTSRAIWRPTTG